jgi:hypothetical protein
MAPMAQIEVRPRTTGEILDDAWRLYLADFATLQTLSSLFLVPLFVAVLWLLTGPTPAHGWQHLLRPGVAALLLPLSGLGSGACQEFFRRTAEGSRATLGACLLAGLRQGGNHAAARGVVAATFFLGSWLLLLPGFAVLASAAALHPILASGERSLFTALRLSGQEAQRQPLKSAAVTWGRLPLLLITVINLYLLVRVALWIGDNFGGFDLAVPGVFLSVRNPVFMTALVMVAWLLLAPYFEAANYLLHVDGRARYEGLDLWYRVRRFFPLVQKGQAVVVLLALAAAFFVPGAASAQNARVAAIQSARQEIQAIKNEITKAEPYPGSERWNSRLQGVIARLERQSPANKNGYRWLHQAIDGFGHRGRQSAVQVLTDLDRRLGLIEDSLHQPTAATGKGAISNEDLKKLLPSEDGKDSSSQPVRQSKRRPPERKTEGRADQERGDMEGPERAEARGPGIVSPHPSGGFGVLGWLILGGALVALVVVSVKLFLDGRKPTSPKPAPQETGQTAPTLETILARPDGFSVTQLWREADQLAGAGRMREAVRMLYLAVLALLHRTNLIRFERTRTNGEYVRQLRSQETLRAPFADMTRLFEIKWYSESGCDSADYRACREFAEDIRARVETR